MRRASSRQTFRLTLLAGFLLGTMCAPVYAANEVDPEIYFYPTKGWNIQQTGGSCSISGRFNNGFVITFDGDERWISGMSVDFQQNIFQSGKTYDVKLSIPGVKDKSFKASGRSGSTLSIGLRKQKDFYQAMRTSSVLDLSLDDNDFRFYLTGFSNSAGDFERCMAGAVMENPENKAGKTLTARSEEDKFMINESIAMEERAKTQSQAVVGISSTNPKPVVQEIHVKETVKVGGHAAQENAAGVLDTDVQDLLGKPGMQASQNAGRKRLSEQLAAQIENNPDLIEINEDTSKPLEAYKNLKMPRGMADTPLTPEPTAPPAEEMAKAEAVESVKEGIVEVADVPPAAAVPPKPTTIRKSTPPIKIKREVTHRRADFTNLEPAAPGPGTKEMRKQLLNLEDMVDGLKKENRALNDELKSALKESEDELLTISSENWNLERATMRFNEAERQIKRMGQQLQQERAKHSAEKRDLEAMLFDPQVTDQAQLARLASLEEQLRDAEKGLEDQRLRYEEQMRQRWEASGKAQ